MNRISENGNSRFEHYLSISKLSYIDVVDNLIKLHGKVERDRFLTVILFPRVTNLRSQNDQKSRKI